MRDLGVHHSELVKDGVAFAVRRMTLDFQRAAHIDDLLEVVTEVASTTPARLNLRQSIRRDGTLLCVAEVQVVAIKVGGGPARLPAELRVLLTQS